MYKDLECSNFLAPPRFFYDAPDNTHTDGASQVYFL